MDDAAKERGRDRSRKYQKEVRDLWKQKRHDKFIKEISGDILLKEIYKINPERAETVIRKLRCVHIGWGKYYEYLNDIDGLVAFGGKNILEAKGIGKKYAEIIASALENIGKIENAYEWLHPDAPKICRCESCGGIIRAKPKTEERAKR